MGTALLALVLCLGVTEGQSSPGDQTGAVKTKVVIEGILLKPDGSPAARRTVFAFPIDENGRIMQFAGVTNDGRLLAIDPDAHPNARTNARGEFRITSAADIDVVFPSDDTILLGGRYSGYALGVFESEKIVSLPPSAKPLFLKPQSEEKREPALNLQKDGSVLVIQFGKVVIPE